MKINRLIVFFAFILFLGSCTKDDLEKRLKESEDMTTFYFVTQDSKNLDVVIKANQKDQEIYWEENGERYTEVIPEDGILNLPSNTNLRVLNNVVEELSCSAQSLKGFNLDSLSTLKVLNLSNSGINGINVSKNTKLEKLSCSNTSIISIALLSNTNLKEVDLSKTSINELDISNNSLLNKLNVSDSGIKEINLAKNIELVDFICQNTAIVDFDFTCNSKIENINIDNNAELVKLNLAELKNIKTLSCNNLQKIEKILYKADDFTTVPAIIKDNNVIQSYCSLDSKCRLVLNTSANYYFEDNTWKNIRDIPASLKICNLRSYARPITLISLEDNKVTNSDNEEIQLLANEEVELYIPANGHIVIDNSKVIKKIEYMANDVKELDLTNCYALEYLDVNNTKIEKLDLTNCTNLKYFYCSLSYSIEELDLTNCTELVEANCGQTSISNIDISKCSKLEVFSCPNTDISTLDLLANTNLRELSFGRSKITSIDCTMLTNLEYLNAERLELTSLDLTACTKLKSLHIPNTSISSIDLSNCVDLTEIYCETTQLTSLDLSNKANLTDVYCGNNELLETLILSNCTALSSLNCSNTKVNSLNLEGNTALASLTFGDCPSLTSLDLSKNINLTYLDGSSCALSSLDISQCPLITYMVISYSKLEELNLTNTNSSLYIACYDMPNISKIIYNAESIDAVPAKIKDKGTFQDYCFEDKECRLYINDTKGFYFKYTGKHPEYDYDIGEWFEVK